jgi:SAM-dependent methyltransferase
MKIGSFRLDRGITRPPAHDRDWVDVHRQVWLSKSGLRHYYTNQIFERIAKQVRPGQSLELGAGTGFMKETVPGLIRSDLNPRAGIDVCFDVHAIPFADNSLNNVVGVDILHHFAKPGLALSEMSRVLAPGGRLILVEPWTGPLGTLFYRYIHHEECELMDDPWQGAFADGKPAMDGNAIIPKTVLWDRADELSQHAPNLEVIHVQPFGCLSFLLTGGFQPWGLSAGPIKALISAEDMLPEPIRRFIATRALFVLEKRKRTS